MDSRDLAARCASALGAQKLIYIDERAQLEDTATGASNDGFVLIVTPMLK